MYAAFLIKDVEMKKVNFLIIDVENGQKKTDKTLNFGNLVLFKMSAP